jgi:sulfite reductase (NADPH) flavoprotein alpha-component
MQQDVERVLEGICQENKIENLAAYKANGQILSDCY